MALIAGVAALVAAVMMSAVARADVTVVEYYHSGFGHHFITPVPAEIALLDTKTPPFELWSRTGLTFRACESNAAPAGSVAICRFFNSSFAPKSSHFYAPKGLGCDTTLANYPDRGLEDDRLFFVIRRSPTTHLPARVKLSLEEKRPSSELRRPRIARREQRNELGVGNLRRCLRPSGDRRQPGWSVLHLGGARDRIGAGDG